MKKVGEQLYHSMMADILHCRQKGLAQDTETECCFHICNKYWIMLRERVAPYEFETVRDEIEFFKTIKPKFISEIQYYSFLSHAELFPKHDIVALKRFWQRESMRLEKFIQANQEFYDYYKAGRTDKDEQYFVRASSDPNNFLEARVFDPDAGATTSHDHLVSTLLTLERYNEYVSGKLTTLASQNS